MDVKALAKSKRSHTQHHSKKSHGNHHIHKLKSQSPSSPSSSGSNDASKKPLGKQQVNEKKPHRSRTQGSSALPTNWDRYEEEELGFGSEGASHENASKTVDVVMPKSKGADFRHLVAEAQSHAETSLEEFASMDDSLPEEFGMGLSSMLAIRGEGILSWIGDDNFIVEDKPGGNPEASLISLNFHAIAENLAKLDLSKRLFIEPDLLPSELCVEDFPVESNEEPAKLETAEDSELANRISKELNLDDFSADQFTSSSSAAMYTLSNDSLVPDSVNVEFQQVASSSKSKLFPPSAEPNLYSTEDTRGKQRAFEAAAAEEELDMLLDSLSETKILDPPHILNKEAVSSKSASVTASLDDALDDLLGETSTLMNSNVLLRPHEEKHVSHSGIQTSSNSGSKAQVIDDFDSWFDTL